VKRILVTGGCGFIGSHFVRRMLARHPGLEVVNLDALTYAGNPRNVEDVAGDPRYRFVHGSITDRDAIAEAAEGCDAIVNFAAETHVDRSIQAGYEFVTSNVIGPMTLLAHVREHGGRMLHVSTDEVYGDIEPGAASKESDKLEPSSPYSAAKAGGDLQVLASVRTYGIDAMITRGSNTYGPFQYPEKMIPLFTTNLLDGQTVPVYGDGRQARDFIWVEDHCSGIELALERGSAGEVYNVGGGAEIENIETTRRLLELTGRDESLVEHVADRLGHDRRYALDCSKLRALGWAPETSFAEGLERTVSWYGERRDWWEPIKRGDVFEAYRARQYGART
jgi:dTDP-glucose 4,6-dehydratase